MEATDYTALPYIILALLIMFLPLYGKIRYNQGVNDARNKKVRGTSMLDQRHRRAQVQKAKGQAAKSVRRKTRRNPKVNRRKQGRQRGGIPAAKSTQWEMPLYDDDRIFSD